VNVDCSASLLFYALEAAPTLYQQQTLAMMVETEGTSLLGLMMLF